MSPRPVPRPFRRRRRSPSRPSAAQHGATRARLIDVAGQVFATRGFSAATGKEICRRAGVNAAAINYHFGGIEPLYEAVLHEIVGKMVGFEALRQAVASAAPARQKLGAVIAFFATAITGPLARSWEARVLAREIINPVLPTLLEKEIGRRIHLIKRVIGEVMGLPPEHPMVAIGYISIMAPCLLLLIGDRGRFDRLFPTLKLDPTSATSLSEHLLASAHAGLLALARQLRPTPTSRRRDNPSRPRRKTRRAGT